MRAAAATPSLGSPLPGSDCQSRSRGGATRGSRLAAATPAPAAAGPAPDAAAVAAPVAPAAPDASAAAAPHTTAAHVTVTPRRLRNRRRHPSSHCSAPQTFTRRRPAATPAATAPVADASQRGVGVPPHHLLYSARGPQHPSCFCGAPPTPLTGSFMAPSGAGRRRAGVLPVRAGSRDEGLPKPRPHVVERSSLYWRCKGLCQVFGLRLPPIPFNQHGLANGRVPRRAFMKRFAGEYLHGIAARGF